MGDPNPVGCGIRLWRNRIVWTLWITGFAVFVLVGLRNITLRVRALPPHTSGQSASSDAWLGFLQIENPSQTIQAVLATVPADQSVVFVGPPDDATLVPTYYAASYLVWPHQIALVTCGANGSPPVVSGSLSSPVRAALTFKLDENAIASGGQRQLGPLLRLVVGTEATKWMSFCSP